MYESRAARPPSSGVLRQELRADLRGRADGLVGKLARVPARILPRDGELGVRVEVRRQVEAARRQVGEGALDEAAEARRVLGALESAPLLRGVAFDVVRRAQIGLQVRRLALRPPRVPPKNCGSTGLEEDASHHTCAGVRRECLQ